MEKPTSIRVVSAVANKKQAILYLENGNQLVLKQGDHRLGDLLDIIIPITTKGEVAVVSLQDFSVYAAYEQKTQGVTKFFKMAKTKVSGWFGGNTDTHKATVPVEGQKTIMAAVMGETMSEAHVTEHGTSIDATDEVTKDEVVVAVIENPVTGKKTVIPGVDAIKPLIDHAVKTNSTDAVQAFLQRCSNFIGDRGHSVDDLMRFLEKGDLPLADDGSIIAYKMLNKRAEDVFVDCHSGKIEQRVGSYVCVNEDLVDLNRRNECSNGLHIARRGYLNKFGGSVCVLCKIDPEDVMVVPHNDPNKVRVKGYHIIGVVSKEAMAVLKQNKPMTGDEEALTMVFDAIHGNHIDRIERVQVNGQYGTNVVVTKLMHDSRRGRNAYSHTGTDLQKAAALDDDTKITGSIDPREINKRVTAEHDKIVGTRPTVAIVDDLEEVDETCYCDECGEMTDGNDVCDECMGILTAPDEVYEVGQEDLEAAAEKHDEIFGSDEAFEEREKKALMPEPEEEAPQIFPSTSKALAREMFVAERFEELWLFKRTKKKSWSVLGFTDNEEKKILSKKP